ncbi:MAG: hypothetical protein CSYNP_00051 [Syntrophus sp. SKADARSKE-3]|nr:hypothetical protein [Syntrophus sp. SKADARSKE-3]
MMIAYWDRERLDIYRIVNKRPVRFAAGSLDKLTPVRKVADKKILIIGRDRLVHLKKRYPPAPEETLRKAVDLEIGELVPLTHPACHCRIFESYGTHIMLDIWAWETDQYARLNEVFPFNAVVPEDILFSSANPEMSIYHHQGAVNMLVHGQGKFFAGATFPTETFSQGDMDRFIEGLAQYRVDITKIKIYGTLPFSLAGRQLPEIANVSAPAYPPCLDYFDLLDLKKFRVRRDYHFLEKKDFILRLFIYLILGYVLMLYLTMRNYDEVSSAIKLKLNLLDRQVSALTIDRGETADSQDTLVKELNEKISSRQSALSAMTVLARRLPKGSFVTRMVFNGNNTDISLSSKEPLAVLRLLGNAPEIKKVSMKGPPVKDRSTASYNFNMTIEFIRLPGSESI